VKLSQRRVKLFWTLCWRNRQRPQSQCLNGRWVAPRIMLSVTGHVGKSSWYCHWHVTCWCRCWSAFYQPQGASFRHLRRLWLKIWQELLLNWYVPQYGLTADNEFTNIHQIWLSALNSRSRGDCSNRFRASCLLPMRIRKGGCRPHRYYRTSAIWKIICFYWLFEFYISVTELKVVKCSKSYHSAS